jgi:hypothetical protein
MQGVRERFDSSMKRFDMKVEREILGREAVVQLDGRQSLRPEGCI